MAEITWKSILTKLVGGDHLSAEESEWFVDDLMQGNANPAAVGAVLATQQVHRQVLIRQALDVERDAHAKRGRGSEIVVELHGQAQSG